MVIISGVKYTNYDRCLLCTAQYSSFSFLTHFIDRKNNSYLYFVWKSMSQWALWWSLYSSFFPILQNKEKSLDALSNAKDSLLPTKVLIYKTMKKISFSKRTLGYSLSLSILLQIKITKQTARNDSPIWKKLP